MITIRNYFIKSRATFRGCKRPKRKPDFKSSSLYWYGSDKNGKFVIRFSNHWTRVLGIKDSEKTIERCIGSCDWKILTNKQNTIGLAGKCYLKNFAEIGLKV